MYARTLQQILRRFAPLLIALGVIALALIGYLIYYSTTFHVIRTNPKTSAVSYASPYIRVYYSQPLVAGTVHISDPGKILKSHDIKGKVVTLTFKDRLTVGSNYTISIDRISSTKNDTLFNKVLTFTAQDIKTADLPADQQEALVKGQDQYPYEVTYLNYVNFSELIDYGMPSQQLTGLKQSLYDYSQVAKQQFWTMTIVKGSVGLTPHASTSTDTYDTMSFNVKLGDITFKGVARYSALSDTLQQLQLYKPDGSLVFDTLQSGD